MQVERHRDWDRALVGLPADARDAYWTSAYAELHAHEGEPIAYVIVDGSHRLVVAGTKVSVPGAGAFDLQTPNGYGGPLVSADAPASFLAAAWEAWRRAAASDGVVAAFFRLHPLLRNERWLPDAAKTLRDRWTVFVDLAGGIEPVWKRAESRHRNMVNRARKENAVAKWNDAALWDSFAALYAAAMQRLDAPARLKFDAEYFSKLRAVPGAAIVALEDSAGLVAANVFIDGPLWAHYHLAARREDAPNFAMSFLMQSALERAAERGLRGVHLGGGATTAEDDRLLKFKRSFGGEDLDFSVALVVADDQRYSTLLADWTARAGRAPSWLLGYRQPL